MSVFSLSSHHQHHRTLHETPGSFHKRGFSIEQTCANNSLLDHREEEVDFHGCVFLIDPSPGLQNTPWNFQDLPQERLFSWTNMSADQRGFRDGETPAAVFNNTNSRWYYQTLQGPVMSIPSGGRWGVSGCQECFPTLCVKGPRNHDTHDNFHKPQK